MNDDLIRRSDAIKAIDECYALLARLRVAAKRALEAVPTADRIVRCKECKHRPIKEEADEDDYGFNLIGPTEDDEICPCLVDDGWYSWMPPDDFFCGYGERSSE